MNMKLIRNEEGSDGIFGQMISEDGKWVFCSLEHAFADGLGGYCAIIPPGTYTCKRYNSPHFGYVVFEICNVPGHQYIEIHIANFNNELEGCVALGTAILDHANGRMLFASTKAFKQFMELQMGVDQFTLTVV